MILGQDELQKRIEQDSLLIGLGERDQVNPEGVGRDLRIGAAFRMKKTSRPFIEADVRGLQGKRQGSETVEIVRQRHGLKQQPFLTLKPGDYVLVETLETLNTPTNLMPVWFARSTLQRNGLLLITTKIDPGYQGKLIAGLVNLGPVPVKIQMGARIANIVFHEIKGKTIAYRGQHQGGRVNSGRIEQQV
ncbi:MAG: dCTP deaminase [bacterium]|nr:dCTP deaminase [bacterium]